MKRTYLMMIPVALATLALVLVAAHFTRQAKPPVAKAAVPARKLPSPTPPKTFPFSLTFAGTVNAYADAHGKERIRKATCLQGDVGHYFCAFVFQGLCRGAFVDYRDGEVDVQKAGQVHLPPARCTARNVFRYARKG